MSQERPSTSSSKACLLNLSAKGVRPITRSVSMEHLSAFTTISDEHGTPSSTANADVRPSVTAQTPEVNTARQAADPAVSNFSSQQREVDTPPGERMEEDTTLCDNTDNDAGGCWKTVQRRRRDRHMHAEAQPPEDTSGIPDAPQPTTHKPSRNQNPPPLPLHDEKIILRPHGGLCLDSWTRPELANALWSAAGLTTEDRQNIIFRLRPQQNLAVISTPQSHVADALYKVRELRLGQRVYPITTYFAAPDNSCKGIVPGLVPGTLSSTLVDELLTPGTQILQARMMGQTNVALVTFEGLKVPRYVRFYGAELRCYPHRPRQLVCKICHRLGHWADHCPTPHVVICATCGIDNPAPSHPCTPHCRSCDGSHPTSDPNCPLRARQTSNKAWVRKALKKEQRELQPPSASTTSKDVATTEHSQVPTQGILRARSKSRSRSRRKSKTRSKSRSRSRGTSMRPPEKRPPDPPSPPSQQPYKKALLTNASAKVAQAPTETQRISAQKTATQAPREARHHNTLITRSSPVGECNTELQWWRDRRSRCAICPDMTPRWRDGECVPVLSLGVPYSSATSRTVDIVLTPFWHSVI
ncbi:hypothetical protein HPB52_016742 [Rhipicephalus sanguineus]|uniref:Uncharacterized protein n=1 Tax=Rhipicephalus sanguineus TaxID=34632 RepID=A0A9D4PH24_RHISA|nr:hypothetical protein HPB52_016742 [Rhipicephalus sanguineus]